jgi:hypothetical protein
MPTCECAVTYTTNVTSTYRCKKVKYCRKMTLTGWRHAHLLEPDPRRLDDVTRDVTQPAISRDFIETFTLADVLSQSHCYAKSVIIILCNVHFFSSRQQSHAYFFGLALLFLKSAHARRHIFQFLTVMEIIGNNKTTIFKRLNNNYSLIVVHIVVPCCGCTHS